MKFTDKFKEERVEINKQMERYSKKVSNLEKSVDELINFSRNLPSLWTSSQYNTKVRLQNFIFPSGITYNKKNDECRTKEINPLFSYIAHLKRGLEKKEIGTNEVNFNCADLVGNTGLEPVTPTLSR